MITEQDLREAIAECQGQRNPNANTCIKLAAYYTIRDHIREKEMQTEIPTYSMAAAPLMIDIDSDTEFAEIVSGRSPDEIMPVLDELMVALEVMNPRLYAATMRKLREL